MAGQRMHETEAWPLYASGFLIDTLVKIVADQKHEHIRPDCPLYHDVRWSIPACTAQLSCVGQGSHEKAWMDHFRTDHGELLSGMAQLLEAATQQLHMPSSEHSGTPCPLQCAQLIPSSIDSFPLRTRGEFSTISLTKGKAGLGPKCGDGFGTAFNNGARVTSDPVWMKGTDEMLFPYLKT